MSTDDRPQLQPQAAPWSPNGAAASAALPFVEEVALQVPLALQLPSQAAGDAARAATAVLPPLQSVVELTTAARPPERGGASPAEADAAAAAPVGRQLADGSGVLADGTRWEKKSGVDLGPVSLSGALAAPALEQLSMPDDGPRMPSNGPVF